MADTDLIEPATNGQIKEIFARNEAFPRIGGRRKKTVGLAQIYLDELDALLERVRVSETALADQAARIAELEADSKDASDYIDQLNVLCGDFGCEAGSNRLFWLHEQLTALTASRAECEGLRAIVRQARELLAGPLVGVEWKRACHDFIATADAALSQKETGV